MNWMNKNEIKDFIVKTLIFIAAIVLVGIMISCVINLSKITSYIAEISSIMAPFINGLIIAYLLNSICNKINNKLNSVKYLTENKAMYLSIFISELLLLITIIAVLLLIVPQVVYSIKDIGLALPSAIDNTQKWVDTQVSNNKIIKDMVGDNLEDMQGKVTNFIKFNIMPNIDLVVTNVALSVKNIVMIVVDFILGIIISIFALANKESFNKNGKRLMYALLGRRIGKSLLKELKVVDSMFSGFFVGKIIDSLIVGITCFIILSILGMPYTLLVSVIVGITNIVPIVGPFIGAIPSTIIILSVDPIKAVWFIIFIIVLQQIDGHILGPKLIGNATGLNTFWVLFAIIFFGGIWGIAGMIIGVPLVAVIKDILNKIITIILNKRKIGLNDI